MSELSARSRARDQAINRKPRGNVVPQMIGEGTRIPQFFGENIFKLSRDNGISPEMKEKLLDLAKRGKHLPKEMADEMAKAVTRWALKKGATHFCHWFHPLTGFSAEKHDAFLDIVDNAPIERLSGSQLMQGEPDASSFPNGGIRSTFEARGYTAWDISSPIFITEGINGKTIYIPTAFVSYNGEALDTKTPLLRSIVSLSKRATEFLNLTGHNEVKSVHVNCGAEQEYFLIDKSFYYLRPDLMMSGRTLFGAIPSRHQQLEDHYFGIIPDRVLSFMQELEYELYRLGIPAKTRHCEVAPAQFELAQIYTSANEACDQNHITMDLIKRIAKRHDMMALLHERPFDGVNGSGKHINWSIETDTGVNLLDPGKDPRNNTRFLAMVAITLEAINRHSEIIRASVADPGNDHRLGANEAPPSILSAYLGDMLDGILQNILSDKTSSVCEKQNMDLAEQLVCLSKDTTDRNRTSPFAFTGNRFEFRAVGSSADIGTPLTYLNAAVADILSESNEFLKERVADGVSSKEALLELTKKWIESSRRVIFNGDGYCQDWVKEAQERGLPNNKNTPEALEALRDDGKIKFLIDTKVLSAVEIEARYNIEIERYNKQRRIEFTGLYKMVNQFIFPPVVRYKTELARLVSMQENLGIPQSYEKECYQRLHQLSEDLSYKNHKLKQLMEKFNSYSSCELASVLADDGLVLADEIAKICNEIEIYLPDSDWQLPKFREMLFIR